MRVADRLIQEINETRRVPLTKAAEEVVKGVMVSGLLNFREIREMYLPHMARSNAHQLVTNLEKNGYLQAINDNAGGIIGWCLSKEKTKRYVQEIGFPVASRYRFIARNLAHDQCVRAVSRHFNRLLDVDWIAHDSLIRGRQLSLSNKSKNNDASIPDLLIKFRIPSHETVLAIEVELSQKNNGRIDRILENRMTSYDWSKVIYLIGSGLTPRLFQDRAHHLRVTSSKLSRKRSLNPIYFANRNEFFERGLETPCEDDQERKASIKEVLETGA